MEETSSIQNPIRNLHMQVLCGKDGGLQSQQDCLSALLHGARWVCDVNVEDVNVEDIAGWKLSSSSIARSEAYESKGQESLESRRRQCSACRFHCHQLSNQQEGKWGKEVLKKKRRDKKHPTHIENVNTSPAQQLKWHREWMDFACLQHFLCPPPHRVFVVLW